MASSPRVSLGFEKAEQPLLPHVIVLIGATGDLARRKLLPGLFHLLQAGLLPDCRIIGVSLDELDTEGFRTLARKACEEFGHGDTKGEIWNEFERRLDYLPITAGPDKLTAVVDRAESELGENYRILPKVARSAVQLLGDAKLTDRARIIMEKPFGTDLPSAQELNRTVHEYFS